MSIFITSDLHFGHDRAFMYEPRGFKSIQEHDEEIIRRWNSVVTNNDDVYILGDVMLNDNLNGMRCLNQLNGDLHFIFGNHDTDKRQEFYYDFGRVLGYGTRLKYRKFSFFLSHYPTLTDNFDTEEPLRNKVINLCGHSHTQDPFADWGKGVIYHCELDAHNGYPVLLDNIIEDIKERISNG